MVQSNVRFQQNSGAVASGLLKLMVDSATSASGAFSIPLMTAASKSLRDRNHGPAFRRLHGSRRRRIRYLLTLPWPCGRHPRYCF